MLQRTEGIVLKTTPFGEADLIVTYLTKDYGLLKTFAKSPRKVKSRFGSSLEPLTCSRIAFWGKEDANLPRLTQADIINSFQSIRASLSCYLRISEIIELTLTMVPEREVSDQVYKLFVATLLSVENDCSDVLHLIQYKVKLLGLVGLLPKIDNCGRCGKGGDYFFVAHGTVLCGRCSHGGASLMKISGGVKRLYASLRVWPPSQVARIKPTAELMRQVSLLLDEHIKHITDREFRTKAFTGL